MLLRSLLLGWQLTPNTCGGYTVERKAGAVGGTGADQDLFPVCNDPIGQFNTAADEWAPLTAQNLALGACWWLKGLIGPLPRPQGRVIAALGFVRLVVLRPEHRSPTPLIQ